MEPVHVQIIAEVGQAHDGSLGTAHAYVEAIAAARADCAKFQTHIAEAESSVHEPFRVQFSRQDASRFDYWKRMEFTEQQWRGLKQHCDESGIEFLSSPFSNQAVDLLEQIGVKRYKIGSGEVTNFLLLERIARTGKPVLLSSGMSTLEELDDAVAFFSRKGIPLAVLQCTTRYPTEPEDIGLNMVQELAHRYPLEVGFSDHSGTIFPALAAVALGASLVEVHVVLDRRVFGPDTSSSVTIEELASLVKGVRFLERARENPVYKGRLTGLETLKSTFGKSLAVNRDVAAGERIDFDMLEGKKPLGFGIPAHDYSQVIGKRVNRRLHKFDFLRMEDIDG